MSERQTFAECDAKGCMSEREDDSRFCHKHQPYEVPFNAELTEGVKYDAGKPRMDLLPFDAVTAVAVVLTYGAAKYADRNWEKGMKWGRLLGAALRHLFAWARGEDIDEESKLPHLSHAACCVLMLLSLWLRRNVSFDTDPNDDRKLR